MDESSGVDIDKLPERLTRLEALDAPYRELAERVTGPGTSLHDLMESARESLVGPGSAFHAQANSLGERLSKLATNPITAADAESLLSPMQRYEPPRLNLDHLELVEPSATEASIRELIKETRAEGDRNLARWEASEAARTEERRQADDDRRQAEADRAADAHRYRVNLTVAIIAAVLTGIGAFVGGLAL